FNPQEFFLPEELLPPKKQEHDRSSSSTSALPQEFEIGESSRKTSLECHEEQIEEILNHLDELSLDRIEKHKRQHRRKQLGQNNKIALARFKIADLEKSLRKSKLVTKQIRKVSWMQSMNSKSTRKDRRTTKLDFSYSFC
nr:hypothetical protein [Tanacetum cinerariifolium]